MKKKISISFILFLALLGITCSNNMQNMYLASASVSSFPTGTVIDQDGDGRADGMDVDGDGVIDMRYVAPIGIPATGIDINDDGTADFYMYTTSTGSTMNTAADGSGTTVTTVISNGSLVGYDLDGDGAVNINVSGSSTFYTVGGSATGVASNVILALTINNSSFEYLTVSADGAYTFTSQLIEGYFYSVSIASSTQDCTLSNSSALMGASDVTNVNLVCGTYTVGGNISPALTGTMLMSLTINNTTTEFLTVNAAATSYTFASKMRTGSFYEVLIVSATDTCTITANTGTMAAANVTGVNVTCSQYTVSGTITPALTSSMILSLSVNGTIVENLTRPATSTTFAFSRKMFDGDVFEVQIVSTSQNCTISSNVGTISLANFTTVAVNCGQYLAQVQILAPTTTTPSVNLSLSVNGVLKETKSIASAGVAPANPYSFTSLLLNGDIYNIQITSSGVSCTITGGAGTVSAANVMASITCAQYTVGNNGTIAGFVNPITFSLDVNGVFAESKTISTQALTFTSVLKSGDSYSVQIVSSTDRCKISNNSGVIVSANITSVLVECAQYTVGNAGAVTGLTGSITMALSVNGTYMESLTHSGGAAFTFLTKLYNGDAYSVSILTTSADSCTISANTGTISAASVTSLSVVCAQFTVGGTINPTPLTVTLSSNLILSLYVNGVLTESLIKSSGLAANTAYSFSSKLYTGDIYDVQISTTQNCRVYNSSGTIAGVVSNVDVKCGQYTVGGNVVINNVGSAGNITFELQVISGSSVYTESITKTGLSDPVTSPYTFTWKLLSGDTYDVHVLVETITGVSCTPAAAATGTIVSSNITTAHINCP